jgi:hypothetical protein
MRVVLTIVLASLLASSAPAFAGGRRRAAAVSPSRDDLTITFIEARGTAGDAVLDTGSISYRPRRNGRRTSSTSRRFGIRVGAAAREPRGTATIRAWLETTDPNTTIRIDDVVLSTVPRVIVRQARIGVVTNHRLEIEVPLNAPEGPVASTIRWEVSTN